MDLSVLKSIRVFPDPNLPQISESSPCGNLSERSTKRNFCLGVGAAEAPRLATVLSCGQVAVQDWNATVFDCWSRGGTASTSALFRYFSIRLNETKLYNVRQVGTFHRL